MIDQFVTLCLKRRQVVWLIAILMAIFGYSSWKALKIEAYPDIADVSSQVITQYPGHAAEEVEEQVTVPLERELNGIPGLQIMRSHSTFGLSLITLVFQDGVDDYWARQRITERIAGVSLPPNANPGLDPLTSPIGEILSIHAGIEIPRPARTQGIAAMGCHSAAESRLWALRCHELWWRDHAISTDRGSRETRAVQRLTPASDCRDPGQQRECRRQHCGAWRAGIRRARNRVDPVAAGPRQHCDPGEERYAGFCEEPWDAATGRAGTTGNSRKGQEPRWRLRDRSVCCVA